MSVLAQIGLVALGSAVGGLARWGAGCLAARTLGTSFPWATLIINITGSFLLGWLFAAIDGRVVSFHRRLLTDDQLWLLLGVGFTGAYTTFSTFELETYQLLKHPLWAAIYLGASVALGFLALRGGIALASGNVTP